MWPPQEPGANNESTNGLTASYDSHALLPKCNQLWLVASLAFVRLLLWTQDIQGDVACRYFQQNSMGQTRNTIFQGTSIKGGISSALTLNISLIIKI
jgi:hypothetical protein